MTTWRDQYQAGSFRGIPFGCQEAPLSGGRRVALHEYPGRDIPYPEDMGKKVREYEIRGVILGDSYFAERDKLIAALEARGPGELVHPYFGRMRVQITTYRCFQSTDQGGTAHFEISFYEAGAAAQPEAVPDTAAAVDARAAAAEAALASGLPAAYSTDGQPGWVLDDAAAVFGDAVDALEAGRQAIGTVANQLGSWMGRIQGLRAQINTLILTPANLANSLLGAVGAVRDLAGSPLGALQVYRGLFQFGAGYPSVPVTTPSRRRQAANRAALVHATRAAAAIAAARSAADAQPYRYTGPTAVAPDTDASLSGAGFATWQEAVAVRDEIVATIQSVQENADDALYPALRDLAASLVAHINAQRPVLACGIRYVLPATQPSLLLAHRIYGDATRAAEIVHRNRPRHPGFMPGGVPLEIIQ
jgi:prophage DNA circulation protein